MWRQRDNVFKYLPRGRKRKGEREIFNTNMNVKGTTRRVIISIICVHESQ